MSHRAFFLPLLGFINEASFAFLLFAVVLVIHMLESPGEMLALTGGLLALQSS
jgi:hypothetical protein